MRGKIRWLACFLLFLLVICLPEQRSYANSAEPPGLVILVTEAGPELEVSLILPGRAAVVLPQDRKGWERYYTFYYHMSGGLEQTVLEGASLQVTAGTERFELKIPQSAGQRYNNLLTLDLASRSLQDGQPVWRVPLLVFLRVVLTLLIEGAFLWIFGYRLKSSWITFLWVNLLTQTSLNLMITGPLLSGYWSLGFIVLEVFVLLAEGILYWLFLKEHTKGRGVWYAVTANLASLILGGLFIANLPV